MDRLEAMAAGMAVEQGELLAAVHQIIGIVDVEYDRKWRRWIALAEQIDQPHADPVERPGIDRVLQSRQGRLAHQVDAALGRAVAGDLQCGIGLEPVDVVAILVAGGDHHHAGLHHVGVGVGHQQRIACIRHRCGDHLGDAEPPLDLPQCQKPAVRREIARVQRDCERLARNR